MKSHQEIKQILEREIERHISEMKSHKIQEQITHSRIQRLKIDKHFHKRDQTIKLASDLGFSYCFECESLK